MDTEQPPSSGRDPSAPKQIGPYRILDTLGEGGMGTVYLAEQKEPIRRRVALKLIKLGMDTKEVVARFEVERQALAMMNHPNIAKVFDAGATPEGRPYFVMEHVPGVPITDYCDKQKLGMAERLTLFTQVCRAVQHAHQNGVMHRDIKPSNILVQMQDVTPTAKIIDFGIAKATNQHLTERTLFTEQGRIIGTPEYMSPEQAEMTGLNVDTRTDVYSLGVLLYELITGALPFDGLALRKAGYLEIQRVIREEEPPRPSTRVSTNLGAAEIAVLRLHDAGGLVRALRGDLDWITMRALEKDPARRYQTASELALDVERHLRHEPVDAGPPSLTYLAAKMMRRHRGPVLASISVVVALAAGLVVSVRLYLEADAARAEARASASIATASAEQARVAKEDSDSLRQAKERALTASEEALRLSEGLRFVAHSMAALPTDPSLALLLAIEGAKGAPGLQSNNALLAALRDHHERVVLRTERANGNAPTDRREASFAFDADAGRVATICNDDDSLRVWSATDGKLIRAVRLPSDQWARPHDVEFSPDGRRVVVAFSSCATVFDAMTWETLAIFHPQSDDRRGTSRMSTASAMFDRTGAFVVANFGSSDLFVWEWNTRSEATVLSEHDSYIHQFAIHPGSGRIATVSGDHTVCVWDLAKGRESQRLRGHALGVKCVVFSPDGGRLLTGSEDGTARLWELQTGTTIAVLPGVRFVSTVAFDPSGRRALTGGWDGVARVWDAETGVAIASMNLRSGWIMDVAFAPDGSEFAVGTLDGLVCTCATETAAVKLRLKGHKDRVTRVEFSQDGRMLGSCAWDGTVRLWERSSEFRRVLPATPGLRHLTPPHAETALVVTVTDRKLDRAAELVDGISGAVLTKVVMDEPLNAAVISPDGTCIATAQDEKEAAVWSVPTGERIALLGGHGSEVLSVTFSKQSDRLLTCDASENVRVFDVKASQQLATRHFTDWVFQAGFDSGGDRVVAACDDGAAYVWSWRDRVSSPVRLAGHGSSVVGACFDPSGSLVLTASHDGTARVWDASGGHEILRITPGSAPVLTAVFSADGSLIATGGEDGVVRLWNATSGERKQELKGHAGPVFSLRFLSDAIHLLSASDDGTARLWHIENGALVATYPAPRGRVFHSWGEGAELRMLRLTGPRTDSVAQIRRVGSGAVVATLDGHVDTVDAATFSPNGSLVATGGQDRAIRIWRSATGECVGVMKGHGSHVKSLQFDHDGRRLLSNGRGTYVTRGSGSGTERGQVFLWDIRTAGKLLTLRDLDSAEFSWDGSRIVACNTQGYLIDVATGETLQRYGEKNVYLDAITMSPAGRWVVTAPRSGFSVVWDAMTGVKVADLAADRKAQWTHPSFDPTGATILLRCGSPDLWRVYECGGFRELLTIPSTSFKHWGGFEDNGRSIAIYDSAGSVLKVPVDVASAAMAAKSRDLTREESDQFGLRAPQNK